MNLNQVTVPSTDIELSKIFYMALGLRLIVDTEHYLRFESPEGESTFSVHLVDYISDNQGAIVYFESDELDEKVEQLVSEGITFDEMPKDQSWLWREARLRDPDGNKIILYHAGENRKNPPWRIN